MHDLRTQLISEGLIKPAGTFEPPRYEHPEPVLRLDEAGRNAVHRPHADGENAEIVEAIERMRRGRATAEPEPEPEPEPECFAFGSAPFASAAPVVLARGSADGIVAAVGRRGSADGTIPATGVRHSASEVGQ